MDYAAKLARLEHLRDLLERYNKVKYESTDEARDLSAEVAEVYGEVADVFDEVVGRRNVAVPIHGSVVSHYPNYFEAGFLSGRTIHDHQGHSELLRVIGKVKNLVNEQPRMITANTSGGTRVFLVHGHDDAALHSCARFLEKLELPITILREQPNRGRTIIEKFLEYSDVGFAVVLLTGDDRGGVADASYEDQKPRARQNVVLELGFFLGKLGRDRVCVLYQDGVEIPSDYSGVLFVPLDVRQAWRLELAKEMKAVGLPIDLNKAV